MPNKQEGELKSNSWVQMKELFKNKGLLLIEASYVMVIIPTTTRF